VLEEVKLLTAQLSSARSGDGIGQALALVAGRFGFTSGLIFDVSKLFDDFGESIIYAARRGAVESLNTEIRLAEHPLVMHAHTTEAPFVMSDVRKANGISEERWWQMFPPYFRGYDGLAVPIHDRGNLFWYIAYSGAHPELSPRVMALLTVAAHAGYARFKELIDPKKGDGPLTVREAECLQLVAQGKTDAEIGGILKISPRTVRFHVGNAKAKLGVTTRIQAIAKQLGAA
jgi:DNA-binding CsgD family transcriptional regulator